MTQRLVNRTLFIFVIGIILAGCGSRPDTEQRPELAPLYEHLFQAFESTFGHDPRTPRNEGDELARDRIINAANRLAERARQEHKDEYEIYLPHIDLGGEEPDFGDPFHLEVTLTRKKLESLGVIEQAVAH